MDKDVRCIYDGILLLGHKKTEILSFETTCMVLEGIMLSKSDREDKCHLLTRGI